MMIAQINDRKELLEIARRSIEYGLMNNHPPQINSMEFDELLRMEMASFVTLKLEEQLRGCIGTTRPVAPLVKSINDNAYSAAFHDPRFTPLTKKEFSVVHISISVLTPSRVLEFETEEELLQGLRPGTDGLIIEKHGRRATFLPAVWESLPDKSAFLSHLKTKAGLNISEIPERAWTYQSIQIQE